MSNLLKTIAAGATVAIGLGFAPAIFAQESPPASVPQSQPHMGSGMHHGGMMGGTMGHNGRMGAMMQMMQACSNIMQDQQEKPNGPSPERSMPPQQQ